MHKREPINVFVVGSGPLAEGIGNVLRGAGYYQLNGSAVYCRSHITGIEDVVSAVRFLEMDAAVALVAVASEDGAMRVSRGYITRVSATDDPAIVCRTTEEQFRHNNEWNKPVWSDRQSPVEMSDGSGSEGRHSDHDLIGNRTGS